MSESYFVARRGKVTGPFDLPGLQKLVRRGIVSRMHEVSADRITWAAAAELQQLFPSPAPEQFAAVAPTTEPDATSDQAEPPSAPLPRFYYSQAGTTVGPVPIGVLAALAQNGTLHPEDMVWQEGSPLATPALQLSYLATLYSGNSSARVLGYAGAPHVRYAGFWMRFFALLLDLLILFAGGLIAGFVLGFVLAAQGAPVETITAFAYLLGWVMNWLYFAMMESSSMQATLGKRALGIVVTGMNGERITFARATGRWFAKIISALTLCIGFIIAGLTDRKQALHDLIASTLVLRRAPAARPLPTAAGRPVAAEALANIQP